MTCMTLLVLILCATVSYALYDIFAAKAGGRIDATLSAVIVQVFGIALPLLALSLLYAQKKVEQTTREGVLYSVLAGLAIAVFSVVFVKIFAKGGELSYVVPVIYGAVVVITTIIGIFLWKESITPMQVAGLFLTTAGLAMVIIAKA